MEEPRPKSKGVILFAMPRPIFGLGTKKRRIPTLFRDTERAEATTDNYVTETEDRELLLGLSWNMFTTR